MRSKLLGGALILSIAAFVFLMFQIQLLTSGTGSLYPAYSSLRSDPLGTKALYDALSETGEYQVSRSFKPLENRLGTKATVLHLGMHPEVWMGGELKPSTWERMTLEGARMVIGFSTFNSEKNLKYPPGFASRLKIHLRPLLQNNNISGLVLRIEDPVWTCLLTEKADCLVAERTLGNGSVVLITKPIILSNEGLRTERDSELLAKILGTSPEIIFDEESLGIAETGSLMGLLRRYQLAPALGVLLVWAGLFIWSGSSSLLPHKLANAAGLTGRSSVVGLTNLFRRSIPEKQLIATCLAEWKKSKTGLPAYQAARMARVEQAASSNGKPVEMYQTISRILQEKS